MNHFFLIENKGTIAVNEQFLGFVVFYKKNIDEKIAAIQIDLIHKLIQNGLKLPVESFLFWDLNEDKIRMSSLLKCIKIEKCFLFGVNEHEIGINMIISNYQIVKIAGIEFLKSDAPEKLVENNNLKNKLWQQLKISFKI